MMKANDNNEKIESLKEKVLKELVKKQEIKKSLTKDDEYFSWLANFTEKNDGKFCNDDWDYNPEGISKEDADKVKNLYYFYSVLANYADEFGINQELERGFYGSAVRVRFGDSIYKIGYVTGQGSYEYCMKVNEEENFADMVIDFNDVKEFYNNKYNLEEESREL